MTPLAPPPLPPAGAPLRPASAARASPRAAAAAVAAAAAAAGGEDGGAGGGRGGKVWTGSADGTVFCWPDVAGTGQISEAEGKSIKVDGGKGEWRRLWLEHSLSFNL